MRLSAVRTGSCRADEKETRGTVRCALGAWCGVPLLAVWCAHPTVAIVRTRPLGTEEILSGGVFLLDIATVQYAILETDGSLSVFPWPEKGTQTLPISIIEDGHLFEKNLKTAGRDKKWVQKIILKLYYEKFM